MCSGGRPGPLLIVVDGSDRRDGFFEVNLSPFLRCPPLYEPVGRPICPLDGLNGIDGCTEMSLLPVFLNEPFGRPSFFLIETGPSGRSDCSLEVSSPMGAILKDGTTVSPSRGLPRGFLGGRSLSLSSSWKKSSFSNLSSSAGETRSSILATGTSWASGVITPSI